MVKWHEPNVKKSFTWKLRKWMVTRDRDESADQDVWHTLHMSLIWILTQSRHARVCPIIPILFHYTATWRAPSGDKVVHTVNLVVCSPHRDHSPWSFATKLTEIITCAEVMDYSPNSLPTLIAQWHAGSPSWSSLPSEMKKLKTGNRPLLCDNPFFFFFSLNTFYFYYKYSSVVTKRSICHEGTAKHKECSAHKTVFVHNTWSGMLIIAGSEKGESPSKTLAINLSSLHPWKTEIGVRGQSHWLVPPAGYVW